MRNPSTFARYRYREKMFPTRTFRLAYDALRRWRRERADSSIQTAEGSARPATTTPWQLWWGWWSRKRRTGGSEG